MLNSKINMKKLNKIYRKKHFGGVSGVKLIEKLNFALRENGLSQSGTKREKIERISAFFAGQPIPEAKKPQNNVKKQKPKPKRQPSKDFYSSWAWKDARFAALKKHGRRCQCCGWRPGDTDSGYLVVDHIKPLRTHPQLALDPDNHQVLCNDCNMGKSYKHCDDFR